MNANKKKILIIEDDQFSLKLYSNLLNKEGYEIIATPNANDVIRLTKDKKPDLFIIDLMLQDGDGFSLIKDLRSIEGNKKTPIIVLSNLGQETDIDEAIKKGANKYFVKSNIRFQEVIDTIKKMI